MASSGLELGAQIITNLFLFFLVMGMASTVDIRDMRRQIRNVKAVSIGTQYESFVHIIHEMTYTC